MSGASSLGMSLDRGILKLSNSIFSSSREQCSLLYLTPQSLPHFQHHIGPRDSHVFSQGAFPATRTCQSNCMMLDGMLDPEQKEILTLHERLCPANLSGHVPTTPGFWAVIQAFGQCHEALECCPRLLMRQEVRPGENVILQLLEAPQVHLARFLQPQTRLVAVVSDLILRWQVLGLRERTVGSLVGQGLIDHVGTEARSA